MTERAPITENPGMQKTHDYRYAFRGAWDREPEGLCRVRILEEDGKPPILLLTELNDNPYTSVTDMGEHPVPELIAKHLPHRFEVVDEDPAMIVEHYEPMEDRRGRRGKPTYDRVAFGTWRPQKVWLGGQERLALGEPDWKHVPDDEVRRLLGDEADDLPSARTPAPDEHLEADYDDRQSGWEE